MWELDHKEGWAPKNWCFRIVVLEKTLESPLDCKEIKLVNPKGNQPWIFIRRTNAEAKAPVLWSPDLKSQLIGKDPDAGKEWGQEEKRETEDEMVGWHHWLKGHEFEQAPGDSEGQRKLACCSPWGCRVRHNWETKQQGSQVVRLLTLMSFSGPINLASSAFLTVPPLNSNCLNLPFETQGRSWSPESCVQKTGDRKSTLHPGAPQTPTGFDWVWQSRS